MRISPRERSAIKDVVRRLDEKAKVYLFGSRTDDRLRGGDIDLLIVSDRLSWADKLDLLVELKEKLGDQKIDLLIKTAKESAADPFVAEIKKSAVLL
jgi:predicted nucleotidyltransferase